MGPLFSALVMLVFGTPVLLLIFAVCKFLLPFRAAVIMTTLTAMGGAVGLVGGLLIQIPFHSGPLESTTEVLLFLGTICLTGILFASFMAGAVWRVLSRFY